MFKYNPFINLPKQIGLLLNAQFISVFFVRSNRVCARTEQKLQVRNEYHKNKKIVWYM